MIQPKLIYHNQGRGGRVTYSDAVSDISFDFEFGAGNCVAIVFIPTEAEWTHCTGRPVAERANIVAFLASQCLQDQLSSGYYLIHDRFIELYRKES